MLSMRIYKLLVIALLIPLLLVLGCGRKQQVGLHYDFAISPKKGEVLKDVTVYLPFPAKDGKPMMEIYESLMRDYKEYRVKEYPTAKVSLIKTRYGTMLKVHVPEVDKRGFGLEGGYGFEEPFSRESIAPRFPITPRLNPRNLPGYKTGYLCDSYIYAEFDNAEEMGVALTYEITSLSPSLLPLDYTPSDHYWAHLGWDRVPGNSEVLVKYYPSSGWQKVPLVDLGYDKE
ncbi:MAG: hypothetical protein IBX64_06685 [Actinobacteria bacterium]|nr:hypothetical protein [Actinomycetota bacterium]